MRHKRLLLAGPALVAALALTPTVAAEASTTTVTQSATTAQSTQSATTQSRFVKCERRGRHRVCCKHRGKWRCYRREHRRGHRRHD
jgi:hypothetical protein